MNLKEAFRYQNKLQALLDEAQGILDCDSNVTNVANTYLRHKVMAVQTMKQTGFTIEDYSCLLYTSRCVYETGIKHRQIKQKKSRNERKNRRILLIRKLSYHRLHGFSGRVICLSLIHI